MLKTRTQKPTIEDVLELSGIELLHPGGLEITARIGQMVDLRNKKVLDVACGHGTLPCYYAKAFDARVLGIDLSPEMIRSSVQKAKKDGVEHLTEFRVADALALPFENEAFDSVINECAVGVTADPQKCLNEMARVTKPGGHVVIHETSYLKGLPSNEKRDIERRLGTVPYAVKEWQAMMRRAGLGDVWSEDWSAMENAFKIRPDRKIKNLDGIFSLREKLFVILPRIISRYGMGGAAHVYQSWKKTNPLYLNGTLGYFLIGGQKV